MEKRRFFGQSARLIAGASFLALMVGACNKQPTATEAPMVAPPMAALPLAGGAPPPQALAPIGPALAAAPTPVRYAPLPPSEGYGYIDQAYSMGEAFADTPPDYAVDYQGTRPWIWRAGDGAYQIVERLPRGERFYYYRAGQDYPFLVRDPDYSYAYDDGDLVGVYGPDGAELNGDFGAMRADEASRYRYRALDLYRAAQYQQRTSAYANEWGDRRDQLRQENQVWQQQQAQNPQWRAWHQTHLAQEQQQWLPERNHRLAYAAAIGLAAATRGAAPDPVQLSRSQAAYFSNWNASHGRAPAPQQALASTTAATPPARTAPPVAASKGGPTLNPQPTKPQGVEAQKAEVASAQSKAAAAAQVQAKAAQVRQRSLAVAQASSAQAARDQQLAARAQAREAAAAKAEAAREAQAQKLADEAKQHEAAAARAKAAAATQLQKAANVARQRERQAVAAKTPETAQAALQQQKAAQAQRETARAARQQQAAAAQTARAERAAAEAKEREAAAAQAHAKQAARAEKSAAQAKQRDAAAAQEKAAQAARAERSAAEAKQREAAAVQEKAARESRAKQAAVQPQHENPPAPQAGKKPDHAKRKGPKDQGGDQPQ